MNEENLNKKIKRGEVKFYLEEEFNKRLNDFELKAYKNQAYFFVRKRKYKSFFINEVFSIYYSSRIDTGIDCGIAIVFNEDYITESNFNSAQLNTNLISPLNLKNQHLELPFEEAYYFHNGDNQSVKKMIIEIVNDFKNFGLKYLDEKFESIKQDEILNLGLDYIEALKIDKEILKKEIEEDLKKSEYAVSRIKNQTFIELKEKLQRIPNQTRENKQLIPKLSFELLELYYSN